MSRSARIRFVAEFGPGVDEQPGCEGVEGAALVFVKVPEQPLPDVLDLLRGVRECLPAAAGEDDDVLAPVGVAALTGREAEPLQVIDGGHHGGAVQPGELAQLLLGQGILGRQPHDVQVPAAETARADSPVGQRLEGLAEPHEHVTGLVREDAGYREPL